MVLFSLVMLVFGGVLLNLAPWYKDSWWLRQCVSPFHLYIFLMEELQFCTSFKSIELSQKGLHVSNIVPPWLSRLMKYESICPRVHWMPLFFHVLAVLVSFSSLCIPLSHLLWSLMKIVPSNIGNGKSIWESTNFDWKFWKYINWLLCWISIAIFVYT